MKKHKRRRNHVRSHVAEEKIEVPYRIEESSILGRYLVACKEIQAGDVILKEEPLVVGPCQESKPICLGCYENLYSDHKCTECNIPLCSQTCSGFHQKLGHSFEECKLLSEKKSIITNYYAITPLRCLALKSSDPEKWKIIESMESHDKIRKNLKIWETNQQLAVETIRNIWGLEQFTEDEIHKVCGVLEVNAFEIASSGAKCLRAIYPNAFLFAHDCTPNTSHSDDKDYNLTVRAIRSIPVNGNITVNYTYVLQSTLKRRKHLLGTKFFSCCCKRCKDPTEFNTFAGAVICQSCKMGKMLSENPLDDLAGWKCDSVKCGWRSEVTAIEPFFDRIFKELDGIGGNDLIGYETFLEKYKNVLYENNYLFLSALHSLSQLYGKIEGYLINDLSEEQLDRKIEICRKLIKIFDKLEPGLSKQRGLLLYELQAPLMVLIRRRMERNSITKKELKVKIKEVCRYLEDAVSILSKEPEDSTEASIAKAAEEALSHLRNSV